MSNTQRQSAIMVVPRFLHVRNRCSFRLLVRNHYGPPRAWYGPSPQSALKAYRELLVRVVLYPCPPSFVNTPQLVWYISWCLLPPLCLCSTPTCISSFSTYSLTFGNRIGQFDVSRLSPYLPASYLWSLPSHRNVPSGYFLHVSPRAQSHYGYPLTAVFQSYLEICG
jgi:hypothetical protein